MDGGNAVNCTFNSNSAVYGGAMNGGSAVNCTFNSNSASDYGGAMEGGSAVNCTFNSNSAYSGGAQDYGSSVSCIFINNRVSYEGGAMLGGSAVNCTFINNQADYGGAIRGGSAEGCNFTNNKARGNGGALCHGSAINCIFVGNSADSSGGAMCDSGFSASNCIFTNNSAKNGGATADITVSNSNFTKNTAYECGGAMSGGSANNCVFKDNKAGINGDDIYNTNVPKTNLIVSNFTSTYDSGDKLLFNFTTASGTPINNANITIRVYKNNSLVGTYYALSGEGWVVKLDVGSYIAVCSVENQAYEVEPANATLSIIGKAETSIASAPVTSVYGENKYLTVNLTDKQGRPISYVQVTIDLNGIKNYTTDKNGQIQVSTMNLDAKTYSVNITFAGNENYSPSAAATTVVVNPDTTQIAASAVTTTCNEGKNLVITLMGSKGNAISGASVVVDLNGAKTYTTDDNGQVLVSTLNLDAETYSVNITFAGNGNYLPSAAATTVVVNPDTTQITASAVTATYNVNKNLVITLKDSKGNAISGASVIVDLNGAKTYTTDKNGQIIINVGKMLPKTYTAKITFNGNNNYNPSSASVKVTVKKAKAKITAKKKTFKRKVKTKKYTITLKNNVGKAIKKAKVTIKINKKTYTAKTNAKGKATFKIKKLTKKGKYSAVVTYKGNKYYNKVTKKVKITVKK